MELLFLLSLATIGSAAMAMGGDDSFEADEPAEPAELDDPRELTGEVNFDDTLIGGSGNDTLTGNRGDTDVLLGGDGDDQLHLQQGNTGTGGEGADRFSVDGAHFSNAGENLIRLTDFNPLEDQLVLEDFGTGMQVAPLPDEEGLGIYSRDGEMVLSLPGVTELPEGSVIFEGQLPVQGWEYEEVSFDAVTSEDSEIAIAEPAAGDLYRMVIAGSGDNAISVSSDGSLINGGAGDDVITVTGDGKTALPEASVSSGSALYEIRDQGWLHGSEVLHHNLFGCEGADTIRVSDAEASVFIGTTGDGAGDLVQLDNAATVLVEAGNGDTVVAADGVERLYAYFDGDGGVLEGGAALVSAWAEGDSTLNGGDGNDFLVGGDGAQSIHGGAGSDTIHGNDNSYHSNHSASVFEYIDQNRDTLDGGTGEDRIYASGGDLVTGGEGADSFWAYVNPDSTLGGTVITDFDPATESVQVSIAGGAVLPEDSVAHGPSYDLRGRVTLSETADGGSSVQVDGHKVLNLQGQTGLNAGFLHTSETGEETWYDLEGNEVNRNGLHIQLSVFHNYRG